MIYTVTLNPSIDYVVRVDNFQTGRTNRAAGVEYIAGGKGVNVSRMLQNLGVQSVAMGFVAGNTGRMYLDILKGYGLDTEFVTLKEGQTRINVKLKAGEETEINAAGPSVSKEEKERFFERLSQLHSGDILILAGSVPKGFADDCYARMAELVCANGVCVLVDTTGEMLRQTLCFHPLLVKPNLAELEELFDRKIEGWREAAEYAKRLILLGAQNVIVSMGAQGAVLVNSEERVHYVEAVKGVAVNSVGAGDSMIAGYLYEKLGGGSDEECLRFAVACGCASTFSCEFATKQQAKNLCSLLTL